MLFCAATPKPGQKFHRHSPNPVIVSKYIKDTNGTDILISPDDCICTSCYNTQCSIVNSTECELNGSDEMLLKSIDDWEATKKAHNTDQLTKAVLSSVIFVYSQVLVTSEGPPTSMDMSSVSYCLRYSIHWRHQISSSYPGSGG